MTDDEYQRLYSIREFLAGLVAKACDNREKLNSVLRVDEVDRLRQALICFDGILMGAKTK